MKYIIPLFLLIFLSEATMAQTENDQPRDVYVKVVNKRGRPVRNIIVQSANVSQAGMTDRAGLFLFRNMTDNDSISLLLPKYGEAIVPVAEMDSIVVTLRSARLYTYTNNEGSPVIIERDKTEPTDKLDVQVLLRQRTYNSLVELLQGRVAGLDIRSSGMGGEVTARVRGERSFLGSNEPLVVVDGMAFGTLSEANSTLNVYDIKTIEVQKSASEWGVRGANGVILIYTK
jgi:hypothetical protein